ncbi:ESX-1 secretion-associated protein EspH [Mycobacterium uberis]|uniref:ESX-1 secretion-associated protein EspH n=1 Tax=Mycobacterium uberis TaxID=2162698 RepID=A0A3E1HL18_9MYCO|nr:hypothetical protein [Mycobacterium uberis]RFD27191.1 ESX-1 secretion-associated protein EspH [Mycobacterium uberis]
MNLPGNDDGDNDLSTLDFYSVDRDYELSSFDALDGYAPTEREADDLDVLRSLTEPEEEVGVDLFTVGNPTKSVSVSALMDGRIHQVQLTDKVTRMGETKLAKEIFVLANLARQKARAAQYTYILDNLEGDKESTDTIRELVGLTLNLPTPEQAAAEEEVFATRYFGEND